MTTPSLEARVAHVEGIVGQVDARLARLETRLDESVGELRSRIEDSSSDLRSRIDGSVAELRSRGEGTAAELRSLIDGSASGLRAEINALRHETRQSLQWILGLLMTMWVTIILAVLIS